MKTSSSTTDSADKTITLTCSSGKIVITGGFQVTAGSSSDLQRLSVVENYPSANDAWTVKAIETNATPNPWTLTAYLICGTA